MNNNLTELVYIIDMSGSMNPLTEDTIGGYNSMLEKQRQLNRENTDLKANVTTVFFDDRYIVVHDRENLDNVKNITDKDYVPYGTTAMLDAIGKTVVDIGKKLAATPEEEKPGLVSVSIITDGEENASHEYNWETVRNMIKEQREKYSWIFTFIGANIDVDKTTYDLGIDPNLSKTYTFSSTGVSSVYMAHAEGACNARCTVACGNMTAAADAYVTAFNAVE